MGRSRARVLGAGLLGLSLVAARRAAETTSGGETAATVDAGIKAGIEQAGQGGTATSAQPAPTSMDAWEALWTEERAAVVKNIKDNKWGKSADGKTVTGPEGFTIDLSKCPAGWSDTEGLSDTSIKIGHTTALSGTLADYGNIPKAMNEVFAYYGAKGAFRDSTGKNRTINLVVKDDGYDAARTIPLVDELIDSEKVFAMWTLGSPNTMKTYDKLNQRCIPQPFSMTGHPAWGDPVNHPWTTGLQLAYNTEAVLWGNFIEQHIDEFDGEANVAALIMNNDFGKSYDAGFKAYLAQSPIARPDQAGHRDGRGLGPHDEGPDDHTGRREPRCLHRHGGRHRLHPDDHRGGRERHEGIGQVPVPALGLRRLDLRGQGQGRR